MSDNTFPNTTFLDQCQEKLQTVEDLTETMELLFSELQRVRNSLSTEAWKEYATIACRRHPIMELLHQDPFTMRAFTKPRGYAGDAQMIDFMYAIEDGFVHPALERSSELGKSINRTLIHFQAGKAVRARRQLIIERLNELAARKAQPHVFSMACGYLREAKRCSAFVEGHIGRYVAADQDTESLAVVERELGALGVEPVHASVKDILNGQVSLSGFDFIYATGLYDYLDLPTAQSLSERLFGMLNPGGRLLLANVTPHLIDVGYMEAYMDWWLIYRTEAQLLQCVATLPVEQIGNISTFTEEEKSLAFMELERKR
jgi:extracellular factor (EF) 3-hydroxypalmitic acid methyl ester biosynthesis protein